MTFTAQILAFYPQMFLGFLEISLVGRVRNTRKYSAIMNAEFVEW